MATKPPAPDHSWHTPYLPPWGSREFPSRGGSGLSAEPSYFSNFSGNSRSLPADRQAAGAFVRSLESTRSMESWRLRQASDALRLLLTAVYGKPWQPWQPGGTAPERVGTKAGGDQLRVACRARGHSLRTEASRADRVRRFQPFRGRQCLGFGDTDTVRSFLEHLALVERVSPSAQAQALNALSFWFSHALGTGHGEGGLHSLRAFPPGALRPPPLRDRTPPCPHVGDCLESGADIRTVQDLLGHSDVSTTMAYAHVLNRPGLAVRSPADA